MGGPAKVTQFYVHRFQVCNEYIFRLNVSMDHVSLLQIQQRVHHLINNVSRFVFAETFLTSQFLVQISVSAILEHHIDVLGVVKIPVEAYNVRVVQSPLNFEFSLHLTEKVKLFEHVLKDDL